MKTAAHTIYDCDLGLRLNNVTGVARTMHSGNASTSEGIQGVNPLIFTGKHLEHRLHRAKDERQRCCR